MFELRLVPRNGVVTFDRQLPFFNWYYPFNAEYELLPNPLLPFLSSEASPPRRGAAYLHVPFCETICSFCPFTRGRYGDDGIVADYVEALVAELRLKHDLAGRNPIDVIFVGGGSPSVLTPAQIDRLGEAVHAHLDTRSVTEFTFELEVKSVTREKLLAMRRVGVNRISFGAQTFSERHRTLFSLTATVSQIREAAAMANELFDYSNVDMIYGMADQTVDELHEDLRQAIGLGTTTIDFYPLNNIAAQVRMHRMVRDSGLIHLDAPQRMRYRKDIDAYFRAVGYRAINGYSYARNDQSDGEVIQHSPKFMYHDIVYGYHDDVVLGYGASALTQMPGYNVYNRADRSEYITQTRSGTVPWDAYCTGDCSEKGIVTFPYRGALDKRRIPWESVPPETLGALKKAIDAGLVVDRGATCELTRYGWFFYVNLMYYLMPTKGKDWISRRIASRVSVGHESENTWLGDGM